MSADTPAPAPAAPPAFDGRFDVPAELTVDGVAAKRHVSDYDGCAWFMAELAPRDLLASLRPPGPYEVERRGQHAQWHARLWRSVDGPGVTLVEIEAPTLAALVAELELRLGHLRSLFAPPRRRRRRTS